MKIVKRKFFRRKEMKKHTVLWKNVVPLQVVSQKNLLNTNKYKSA